MALHLTKVTKIIREKYITGLLKYHYLGLLTVKNIYYINYKRRSLALAMQTALRDLEKDLKLASVLIAAGKLLNKLEQLS